MYMQEQPKRVSHTLAPPLHTSFCFIPLPHWSDLTSVFHLLHTSPSEVSTLLCNTFLHLQNSVDYKYVESGVHSLWWNGHCKVYTTCTDSMCTVCVSAHTFDCHPWSLTIALFIPLDFSQINLKSLYCGTTL